jgi:lysophospholipase L1-like esterase
VSRPGKRRPALGLAVAAVAAAAALAAGGAWLWPASARALPAERDRAVLYVAMGDSTVEGVGATRGTLNYVSRLHARLRSVYPHARATNLGVAGATSADVLAGQLPPAVEARPDLVTLSVGPNDLTGRVSLSRWEQNVDAILATLARETAAVVVVSLLPDLAVTPRFATSPERAAVGRLTEQFNDVLRRAARKHRAQTVDLHAVSRREVPRHPHLVAGDGYHPSDAGYARWAELMWEGVAARLPRS